MKRHFKSILGVTLLEIMLVLAIAALVIVMSVRYYQTATVEEQINTTLEQVQAFSVAADSIAQSGGGYSTLSNNTSGLTSLLPNNAFRTVWGQTITIAGTTNGYTLSLPGFPHTACAGFLTRLTSNSHYTATTCSGSSNAAMTITYAP